MELVTIASHITLNRSSSSGYDRYSFGIGIGRYISICRYIGLTDKENSLSVSVSADTVFYIGTFTDTEKESEFLQSFDIYCLYLQK